MERPAQPTAETAKHFSVIVWFVVSLLSLVLVLVSPASRWIAVQQIAPSFGPPTAWAGLLTDLGVEHELLEADSASADSVKILAEQNPNNYEIQLSAALTAAVSERSLDRLRALSKQFPDRPAVHAHILRLSAMRDLRVSRKEEDELSAKPLLTSLRAKDSAPPTSAAREFMLAAAREGMRLDPANGYFPWMHCIILLAARRDDEALRYLENAAKCRRFDDYSSEEGSTHWAVRERLFGRQTELHRAVIISCVLYPHLAVFRGAARVLTIRSVQLEQKGKVEEGARIRLSLMRVSAVMRVESQNSLAAHVANAMVSTAMSRPGGRPAKKRPTNVSSQQWIQVRTNEFDQYLRSIGRVDDARWVVAESAARQQARTIVQNSGCMHPASSEPTASLAQRWIVGMVLAANGIWLLVMAPVSTLLVGIGATPRSLLIVCALGVAAIGFTAWSISLWAEAISMMTYAYAELTSSQIWSVLAIPGLTKVATIGACVIFPIIYIISLAIIAGTRERLSARSMALINSVLLFAVFSLFGYMVFSTSRREQKLSAALDRALVHEGRYFAELQGLEWPGVTK